MVTVEPPWEGACEPGDAEWQRRLDWFMAQSCDSWWWLSFVDPDRPEGDRHLGVCIVPGGNIAQAAQIAWEFGCNPGGEVAGWELAGIVPHPSVIGRLFTGADVRRLAEVDPREPFEMIGGD